MKNPEIKRSIRFCGKVIDKGTLPNGVQYMIHRKFSDGMDSEMAYTLRARTVDDDGYSTKKVEIGNISLIHDFMRTFYGIAFHNNSIR